MLQENNIINISTKATSATTATTASAASALALFSLSSQSSVPSSPSSPSSFTYEYDTSNYFSRLANETVFTIFAFVITNPTTTTTTMTPYTSHKQLCVLSQVCRFFNKIVNDILLWQIAFETTFDSEAIIRAGIIDNNVLQGERSDKVNGFDGAESEGEDTTTQSSSSFVKEQTGKNIWRDLYKERQNALNKIKDYIKSTLPSPSVKNKSNISIDGGENDDFNTTVQLDDFMEFQVDEGNENNVITNDGDSSTLDSTDKVDDIVDYQLLDFDFDFNFVGSEKDEARTEDVERNNLNFNFEDNEEFRLQELDDNIMENNTTFGIRNTGKENIIKEDTIKEDTVDTVVKEDTTKEDTVKEDTKIEDVIAIDNTVKEDPLKEDEMEFNLEDNLDNLEYIGVDKNSTINVDDVSQDFDFVSEDLIKFDDPELDSIFASDVIDNNFVDTQDSNVVEIVENDKQHDEVLVKDTNNSAKEVDLVTQVQDFSNPEIYDDLDVTHLQDHGKSSKLLDSDEESFKLPEHEESSSKLPNFDDDEPQLQDCEESSTKFQDEFKLQGDPSSKLFDKDDFDIKDDLLDYYENEEVSSFQDHNNNQIITNLQDYNENEELTQLQDFDKNDLPACDENDDYGGVDEVNIDLQKEYIIKNDNYDLSRDNENDPPNGNDDDDSLYYIVDSIDNSQSNHDENKISNNRIKEISDDDAFSVTEDHEKFIDSSAHDLHSQREREKVIHENHDLELLKILNIIWNICQENDGMNSEALLGANVGELTIRIIQSFQSLENMEKMEIQMECLSIALQVLSILISWQPELAINLHKNDSFWDAICNVMTHIDVFSTELNYDIRNNQLILPAPVGSAIHIFIHTSLFNLPNPSELFDDYIPPPQLLPDSNIFNNVYNKLAMKPEEAIIQPFGENFSGKCCGYFAYERYERQLSPSQESAMDITLDFSPSEPGKVYYLNRIDYNPVPVAGKVVRKLSGSGIDKVGEFVIRHGVITEKGKVNFIKTYIGKHSWVYDGVLSPVGICGRWGRSFAWYGTFWIWKR